MVGGWAVGQGKGALDDWPTTVRRRLAMLPTGQAVSKLCGLCVHVRVIVVGHTHTLIVHVRSNTMVECVHMYMHVVLIPQ